MPQLPNLPNPTSTQNASDSKRSESIEPKRRAKVRREVKASVKRAKRLRFQRLAIQFAELSEVAASDTRCFEKEAAGRLLARIYFRCQKQHARLRKKNTAYDAVTMKLGIARARADILFPEANVGQILQEEVKTAERYQNKLQMIRELLEDQRPLQLLTLNEKTIQERTKRPIEEYVPTWIPTEEILTSVPLTWREKADERKIPEDYWPTIDLKPLSAASESEWWKFIWSQLNKKQAEFLPLLCESGKRRAKAKSGRLYLKDFYREFHKHWKALIRLREAGFF
jgi:hypothetical protein